MPLRIDDKREIVAEVNAVAVAAHSAVVADYHGVTVGNLTALRAQARENNVYLRVVRNTLLRKAVVDTDFACLADAFVGPTIIAFSQEEPGAGARLLKEFMKTNDSMQVRALAIGGQMMAGDRLDELALLPSREEALTMLVAVVQAPVSKLVRTLNDVPSKVTRAVAAIRDQKQQAA